MAKKSSEESSGSNGGEKRPGKKNAGAADERYGNFFRKLLEAIPTPIFYKDAQGRYRGGNTAWASDVLGIPLRDVIGRKVYELPTRIPEDLAREYHEADQELMRKKGTQTYEAQVLCADGIRRDFQFHKAVITARNGRTVGIVGVMTDLTEKNRTQRLLARQAQQYETLLSDASVGIYVTDVSGQVIHANDITLRILGFQSLEEMMKVNTGTLYKDPAQRAELVEKLRSKGSANRSMTLRRPNGELVDVQVFSRLRGSRIYGFLSMVDPEGHQLLVVTCAWCNRMRDGEGAVGAWVSPATYLMEKKTQFKNPEVDYAFTHGVCPDCAESLEDGSPS